MDSFVLICSGWVLIAVGAIGCFLPLLPGPPIAYLSLVLAYFTAKGGTLGIATMLTALVLLILVTVLDYVVPAIGAKKFNCSRLGTAGCMIGTVVGLFFLPLGVILGPFLGALTGELISGKPLAASLKGALGALMGYVVGIGLKIAYCAYIAYVFWGVAHN